MPWYENDVEGNFSGTWDIVSLWNFTAMAGNGSNRVYWPIPIPASAGYISAIRLKLSLWGEPMDRFDLAGDWVYPWSIGGHGLRVAAYAPYDPGVGDFRPGPLMANAQYYPTATGMLTYTFQSKPVIGTLAFVVVTGIGANIHQVSPTQPGLLGGANAAARGAWSLLPDVYDPTRLEYYYAGWKNDLSGVAMIFSTSFQPYLGVYYTPVPDDYGAGAAGGPLGAPEDVGLFAAMTDFSAGVDPATDGGRLKFASRLDNHYPGRGGHAVGLSATDSNLYIGTGFNVSPSNPVVARIPPPYAGIAEVGDDEDWTSDLGGEAILSLDLTDGV